MKNSWKKTAAFVLAFTLVAAPLTQTAGKGGLFGGSAITAKAAPPSETDVGVKIGNVTVDKTETLLTTITATGKEQASYSTANVATVSFSYSAQGSSAYTNNGKTNWGWWGYGWTATVTPAEGYTITKCVFYDDANRTATDSEAPFVVETTEEDKTPQVNGTPILANQSKGITKIEVYGYATPTTVDVSGVQLNKTTAQTVAVGDKVAFTATVAPDDATDKTVKWSTSNANVKLYSDEACTTEVGTDATSTLTVYAKGITAGNATVTATSNADNTKTASCDVTVNAETYNGHQTTLSGRVNVADMSVGQIISKNCQIYKNNARGLIIYDTDGTTVLKKYGTSGFISNVQPGYDLIVTKAAGMNSSGEAKKCFICSFTAPTAKENLTYDGTEHDLINAGDSVTGGTMYYQLGESSSSAPTGEWTTTVPKGTVAGTYYVWYKVTATENYYADYPPTCLTVHIKTDISTATVNLADDHTVSSIKIGDDTIPDLSGFDITYGTDTDHTATTPPTEDGTYYAYVTAKDTNADYTGTAKSEAFTVVNAITLTADNVTIANFTYDGTAKTPVLKYGDTTLVKDTDYTIAATEGDTTSATAAGTYTIHINGINDYAGENVALTWKINKAEVNVTADAKSKKYGEDDPVLTYTAGALFGTDAFTGALARAEGEAVNTYAITQGTLSAGDNYNINFTGADFTINKADSTPDAVTGLTAAFGKTLADVELPTGWTWDAPDTSVGDVGNNTFAATFTPTDTANYNNYSANLTVAVTAIPATPTAVGTLNATYGQTLADVALPTVEGGTWAWKDAATTPVGNAGTQTFKAVFTPSSPNYTAIERDITVNVAKADPTPEAVTGLTATYGATLADVALPTGWAWDAPATSVGNVGDNSFAATYTPTDTDNYNTLNQNLTVNVVAVDKTSLNEAIAAANTYLATINENTDYAAPVSTLTAAITAANAVYTNDNVTAEAVAQAIIDMNNAVTTAKAAVKDIDDTKAAQAVIDKINALPAAEAIKSTDKEAIEAAREAYTKLTEAQSAKVTKATTDKLTAAEKAVADRIAADAVIEKINAIGEVVLTNESKTLIDAARTAYEALATDEQKALVSNYATLTAGEKKYSDLQIENAKTKIDVIGDIEFTDESKASIENAKAAYNALTADQKALVANAKVLDYAEKLYDALEAQAAAETAKAEAETDAATAKAAQTKAEADAATAKAAQTKAEEDTTTAKAAQAKAEADAATAKAAQTKAEAEAAQTKAEADAATAKAAQTKAEEDAATAKTAQATAEKAAADAKTAQTKAEEDAAAAKTAQATAEKAAADAKTAQTKAEEDAATAKTAQATAEKAAADAKTAQTKAEEDAATAKTAQATAEKAAADAKTAQTKAEEDAAAAKTAQATAEKNAEAAKAAQAKAEEDAAAAKTAQATAEKNAEAAKTAQATAEKNAEAAKAAQAKAEEDAATAKTAQATAEKNAEAANSKVSDLTEQLAAAVKQIEELESSGNVDEALKKQVAELKEQLEAAKTAQNEANEALAKAQDVAAAKTAAAEAAQEKAEEEAAAAEKEQATAEQTAKEATEKAAAAEKAQATAEQTAKEATEKAAAAEKAQATAEQTAKEATEKAAAAEKAQATAEQTAKEATEKAAAAENAQATAEQTAKEATEKAAAAENAQATAEQTAKEATEKAAAAEEAQKVAEAAQAEAEKKAAEDKAAADQAAADKAIEKINAIGSINKTNYCENKIVRARAIYDSLTDEQKALVPADILAKLTAAENEYDTLPQTGMSGFHKVFAGLAALMGITGVGLVKKSRKKDEEE